jgi:hypothetical protein
MMKNNNVAAKLLAALAVGLFAFTSAAFARGGGGGHGGGHGGGGRSSHFSSHQSSQSHFRSNPSNQTKQVSTTTTSSKSSNKTAKSNQHHRPWHHHHWHYGNWGSWYPYTVDGDDVIADDDADDAPQIDLELLSVEQLDAGNSQSGPAYRVTFRNNSPVDVDQAFNVTLAASSDEQPDANAPFTTRRVGGILANQSVYSDIRLPASANGMACLTAVVNSSQEVEEVTMDNNGTTMNRSEIPVFTK